MSVKIVEKNVLVLHSVEQMFQLVDTVEDYPKFLPWCSQTEILRREDNILEAVVHMDYMRVRQSFSTRNHNQPPHEIHISLLNGPFKSLNGVWKFTPLGEVGCKIDFKLSYEFSSSILSTLIAPVFNRIAATLVDAFIQEADKRYDE